MLERELEDWVDVKAWAKFVKNPTTTAEVENFILHERFMMFFKSSLAM